MIRLNLLPENMIPKDAASEAESGSETKKAFRVNWFILGPVLAAVLYLIYLGVFFGMIRGPLGRTKADVLSIEKQMNALKPKVSETESLEKELEELNAKLTEFNLFLGAKKNWARVLNILSDTLPDEVVFSSVSLKKGSFRRKVRTEEGGLTAENVDTDLLSVKVHVDEDSQSRIPEYMKRLRNDKWMAQWLGGSANTGMALSRGKYVTQLELHFFEELPEEVK